MKKLLTLVCFICCSNFVVAQTADTTIAKKALAVTQKRKGIEVYILSEPVRPYKVTGTVTNEDLDTWIDALAGEETKRTLTADIDVLIKNANKKAEKKKFEYDAIITEDGTTGTCIKFL